MLQNSNLLWYGGFMETNNKSWDRETLRYLNGLNSATEFLWDIVVGGVTTFVVLAVVAFVAGL